MSSLASKPFTAQITNASFTVTSDMGFTSMSIIFVSGTVTVLGTGTAGTTVSSAITMSTTVSGLTFVASANQLSGITITCSSGVYAIIASS